LIQRLPRHAVRSTDCYVFRGIMKSKKEIKNEIEFQEQQYNKVKRLIEVGGKSLSENGKKELCGIMSIHAAKRQALIWALET
jgi:hypothetical protein